MGTDADAGRGRHPPPAQRPGLHGCSSPIQSRQAIRCCSAAAAAAATTRITSDSCCNCTACVHRSRRHIPRSSATVDCHQGWSQRQPSSLLSSTPGSADDCRDHPFTPSRCPMHRLLQSHLPSPQRVPSSTAGPCLSGCCGTRSAARISGCRSHPGLSSAGVP